MTIARMVDAYPCRIGARASRAGGARAAGARARERHGAAVEKRQGLEIKLRLRQRADLVFDASVGEGGGDPFAGIIVAGNFAATVFPR